MKKKYFLTALVLPALAMTAQGQTSQVRNGRCFADVNGDGRYDYIVLTGAEKQPDIEVFLSDGQGFQKTAASVSSPALRGKLQGPAYFIDVNGDHKADYVTLQGDQQTPVIVAYLSGRNGYSERDIWVSQPIDKGYDGLPRGFADINGDGRADYLTFRGDFNQPHIIAYLATRDGFDAQVSYKSEVTLEAVNREANALRAFADVNADGMADYMDSYDGEHINIYPANKSEQKYRFIYPSKTSLSQAIPKGLEDLPRSFVDIDGDRRADYLTFRGNERSPRIYIHYAYGSLFQERPVKSSRVDRGIATMTPAFADVNGDGKWDYICYKGTSANPWPFVYFSNGRDFIAPCITDTKISFFNDAAYDAYFTLSYELNGKQELIRSGLVTTNQRVSYDLPADAKNIEVVGYCNECYDKRRIFTDEIDRSDCPDQICYRVFGTQFKKAWEFESCK